MGFRQKDGAGQGGAHCGQRVESGPAGFCIGHAWTWSSGRCWNFPPVWLQPRLTQAWAQPPGLTLAQTPWGESSTFRLGLLSLNSTQMPWDLPLPEMLALQWAASV